MQQEAEGLTGHLAKSLSLSPATSADVEAIRLLTQDAYCTWVPVIGREPKPMTADYAQAVANHRIELVHRGGRLAAAIEMIPHGDHLLIENVAVSPAFQGAGIGRHLLAHAEKVAASLGYSEIRLYTNKLMGKNIELYSRLGYRIDPEEDFKGGTIVHMSKSVQPA